MGHSTQQKYKQAGLCIKCGKIPPGPKSVNYCEKCRERMNFNQLQRANKWLAAGICSHCGKNPLFYKRHCTECYQKHQVSGKKSRLILRDKVFDAYGGYICACCGETEKAFLTIDHIDGGGHKHRTEIGPGRMYYWLRDNNYPSGFQVLCMNCQWGKKNCGICPHQSKNVKLFDENRQEINSVIGQFVKPR